jgi:hypothetical protein
MTLFTALRQLLRRRACVIVALVCACSVGVAIPYRIGFPPKLTSRQYNVGIASASALVDSTRSQVADLGLDTGSDVFTLAARASLLGSVITGSPVKDEIAHLAGVPANELIATPPVVAGAGASPAASVPDASIHPSDPRANILNVSIVEGGQGAELPIIEIDTQAPTAAIAARLANASFVALQADVNSLAAAANVPALHRLVIRPLGPAGSATATRGVGPLYGALGGIAVFVLACAAILGVPVLRTAWRRASLIGILAVPDAGAPAFTAASAADNGEHDPSAFSTDDPLGDGMVQRENVTADGASQLDDAFENDLWAAAQRVPTARGHLSERDWTPGS